MAKTKCECPMCGEPAERIEKGGQVYVLCEAEDTIYAMTKTGAKVKQRGRLADIERRLAVLEGSPEPEPKPKDEPKGEHDDEEDDQEEDGEEEDDEEEGFSIEIGFDREG